MITTLLALYHRRIYGITWRSTWPLIVAETFLEAVFIATWMVK